jgi:very-short-patch-repair endonuclease
LAVLLLEGEFVTLLPRLKSPMRRLRVLTGRPGTWATLGEAARRMRRNPTVAEDALWQALRRGRLGAKFRRQHVIDRYIVDFFCLSAKLIVELDGPIHLEQQEEDLNRESVLLNLGYTVLRYPNQRILEDIDGVMADLKNHLPAPISEQGVTAEP